MSESARNRIAWTVAGLALLGLVLAMRVLLPPPAMAGMEERAGMERPAGDANGNDSATPLSSRPDDVSELEWQALKGVAAQSRDPARTLTALVEKLRFSKQLELFRSGLEGASPAVSRADLAAQLLADLPARVAAGDMARGEALGLLPSLVEPLEPDPASRAMRVRREAARMPGQALQQVP